jgi:hypothetical protein
MSQQSFVIDLVLQELYRRLDGLLEAQMRERHTSCRASLSSMFAWRCRTVSGEWALFLAIEGCTPYHLQLIELALPCDGHRFDHRMLPSLQRLHEIGALSPRFCLQLRRT